MIKKSLLTVFATLVALAALYAWTRTVPVSGSGWFLFVAIVGSLGLLNSIANRILAAVAAAIVTAASGAAWWFYRDMPHSVWVLALCIICALRLFKSLRQAIDGPITFERTRVRGNRKSSVKIRF